jgi:hypothetical protein
VLADFLDPDMDVQLGREPQRIDLLTFISGVEFDAAWDNHVDLEIGGLTVPVIGRTDLRTNKLASGRLRDLADAADLPPDDIAPS